MTACATHPDAEATGACHRCGRFYCAAEEKDVDGQKYCAECGARDDVDWLGLWARRLEGKRSGLIWFLVVMAPLLALGGLALLLGDSKPQERGLGGVLLLQAAAMALPFFRVPNARVAQLLGAVLVALYFAWLSRDGAYVGLLLGLPFLGLAATTWTDVPTRLWLRAPVKREALRKHFEREGSNPLAVTASRLAFLSLLVPGLGLLSLGLGILAWSRVDLQARPPVGNRSTAAAAVFFSALTSLWWGSIFFARF